MLLAGTELSGGAIVVRNDSTQSLFPLDFAFVFGREIRLKNLVVDIHSLMRALIMIVRQPLAVDVVELIQAYTNKVIKALALYFSRSS